MIKKLKIGLLIAVLSMTIGVGYAQAANLSWGADTPIDFSSPDVDDVTIASGSTASALVVGPSDFIITADSVGTFTVSSASRTLVPSSTTGITQTCTSGVSQIVVAAGTSALTISTTVPICGTGGGGGGGADVTPPTNTSISIAAGASSTVSTAVTLTLAATDASFMMISNEADFIGATWETYATSKTWTLPSVNGVKTVYAKFKDAAGNISTAVSDTITLSGTGAVIVPPVTPPSSLPPVTYNFGTTTLRIGSTGEAVKELQRFLNATMNLGLVVDGMFGPKTTAVMKQWQTAHGLVADGLIGPKTKAAMLASIGTIPVVLTTTYNFGTTTLRIGSTGEAVKELQRFLNATMNLGLVVDGMFGPKTTAVMKQWQTAHGLVADGLIGPKTKAAMLASIQ